MLTNCWSVAIALPLSCFSSYVWSLSNRLSNHKHAAFSPGALESPLVLETLICRSAAIPSPALCPSLLRLLESTAELDCLLADLELTFLPPPQRREQTSGPHFTFRRYSVHLVAKYVAAYPSNRCSEQEPWWDKGHHATGCLGGKFTSSELFNHRAD
jgi:hypothetical protein